MFKSSFSISFKVTSPSLSFGVGDKIPISYTLQVQKTVRLWSVRAVLTCVEFTEHRTDKYYQFERVKTVKIPLQIIDHREFDGQIYEPGDYSNSFELIIDPRPPSAVYHKREYGRKSIQMPYTVQPFPQSFKRYIFWEGQYVTWNIKMKVVAIKYETDCPLPKEPKEKSFGKTIVMITGNWNTLEEPPKQIQINQENIDEIGVVSASKNFTFVHGGYEVKCSLDKNFYWSGESINIRAQVIGNRSSDIEYISFQLIRFIKSKVNLLKLTNRHNIQKTHERADENRRKPLIDKHKGCFEIDDVILKIPQEESSFRGYLVNRVYQIRVIFHTSGKLTRGLKVKIPVVVLSPNPTRSITHSFTSPNTTTDTYETDTVSICDSQSPLLSEEIYSS